MANESSRQDSSEGTGGALSPSSYDFYDRLYRSVIGNGDSIPSGNDGSGGGGGGNGESNGRSRRVGSVEVVPPGTPIDAKVTNVTTVKTDRELALLPVTSILQFSYSSENGTGHRILTVYDGTQMYKGLAGFLMGMHHFNNGDGSVVREVGGINETCNVRLVPSDVFDSETDEVNVLEVFMKLLLGDDVNVGGSSASGGSDSSSSSGVESSSRGRGTRPRRPLSVLFGPSLSSNTVPLSILTNIYDIPHFSSTATSTELDNKHKYEFFSRLVPSDHGTALAAVTYFRDVLRSRHVGVFHVNDVYGTSYYDSMEEIARTFKDTSRPMVTRGFSFSPTIDARMHDEIRHELGKMKQTGYKVFFGVIFDAHYDIIMEEAVRLGIAGEGYSWLFSDGVNEFRFKQSRLQSGSPLAIATQGIGILKPVGGHSTRNPDSPTAVPPNGYDRFLASWQSQGAEAVAYYNSKNPTNNSLNNAEELYYNGGPDFFRDDAVHRPSAETGYGYDTMIALGLAACAATSQAEERGEGGDYFDGTELFDNFLGSDFDGATGRIRLSSSTYSRDPATATFLIINAYATSREDGEVEGGGGGGATLTFDSRPALYTSTGADGSIEWRDVEGSPFLHSDNGTFPPDASPFVESEELNHIGVVRPVGLTLSVVVIATSLAFFVWSQWRRDLRIVRASQPLFLKMICVGTSIMGASIIPMSVDDAVVVGRGLDTSCMAWPWLFTIGFTITFSALFSKIWRVNKLYHHPDSRRIKVTEWDLLIPFIVLLALNVVFLLVWTLLDPLRWTRIYIGETDVYGREWNSIGFCTFGNGGVSLAMALLVFSVNVVALLLANIQAYHARNIEIEYNESRFVALAVASVMQAFLFGLPIMFLVKYNPPASFFVRSVIVFVICMATLLLVFVPKLVYHRTIKKEDADKESDSSGMSFLWDSVRARAIVALGSIQGGKRISSDDDLQGSNGALGLKVLNHPLGDSDEVVSLKSQIDQYKCVSETLANSLMDEGVDRQSIVERFPFPLVLDSVLDEVEGRRRESWHPTTNNSVVSATRSKSMRYPQSPSLLSTARGCSKDQINKERYAAADQILGLHHLKSINEDEETKQTFVVPATDDISVVNGIAKARAA